MQVVKYTVVITINTIYMSNIIDLKKGLNIPISGVAALEAKKTIVPDTVAIKPTDFKGFSPRLLVKEGDKVLAGSPVLADKQHQDILLTSPVSGTVQGIVRGEKRKLLAVLVKADGANEAVDFGAKNPSGLKAEEVKDILLKSGLWPFIIQRPYGIIADPALTPKAIFVSAFSTAPLAADAEFAFKDEVAAIQAGVTAVSKLAKVHVCVNSDASAFAKLTDATVHTVNGKKHPAGNVGVQISHISPIKKGETVWTLSLLALAAIGKLFKTGRIDLTRKVAVTGRSMENIMKVSTELGYMKVPKNTMMDIHKIKGLPLNQQVIVTTGSQGEEMSALYRMAFSTHKQVDIGAGDKVIISASAIPGNEVTVGRVINELFRKGADVVYDKADMLHVSGHACQEELKIIHALTRPKFFIPLHGEQRMLQIHKRVAESMGMAPNNICVADNGSVIELTTKHMKCETTVPAGEVFVDGGGVGEVGAVVLNDRKILAEDGMVVVVLSMSSHDHQLLCDPEIVTRGFVYVKESEELLQEMRKVAMKAVDSMSARRRKDDGEVCRTVKSAVSSYLYKQTKRSPMIIPMVTKL